MQIKSIIALCNFLLFISNSLFSQDVYPTNWWPGMKYDSIQLLIHGKDGWNNPKLKINYPGIKVLKLHQFENSRYLAIDIVISPNAKPSAINIELENNGKKQMVPWLLKERRKGNGNEYAQGVTSADLIYLLMPDRFSNGDPSNDRMAGMNDTNCDRQNPFLRHGGDLQGIINHLDYFNEIGITALWLTPVIENDQPLTEEGSSMRSAYHGYAFTNQYQVDRRLGGNESYRNLVASAHQHGLKIIQDAVYNHIGNQHFLFIDPPAKNWFNQWPSFTKTNYKDQPMVDPYASVADHNKTVNGWFTSFMPDLNQQNPYVSNFLIQHALWTVEEFGIDGWRVDTYFYSDRDFLNRINSALYREFPHISIFGETTMESVTEQAYYMQNNINTSWKSNLQGVTDYAWFSAAIRAVQGKAGSGDAFTVYNTLVQDVLYKNPLRNEIFLDNHDQNRFYSMVGEDFSRFKMGIALLLTQRGIPQIYYGTEILMKNMMDPTDAEVRKDFPGGWKTDSVDKFLSSGRAPMENEAFEYVKKMANFRKSSTALKTGRLMQFLPENGLYVYFRYDEKQTVMCILNDSGKELPIDFKNYTERVKGFAKALNIADNNSYLIAESTSIPAKTLWVLALK